MSISILGIINVEMAHYYCLTPQRSVRRTVREALLLQSYADETR